VKTLFLFTLLFLDVSYAQAAAPELVCDPEAKVIFHSPWFGHSTVKLESNAARELPWTGKERVTTARQLKEQRLRESELEANTDNEELFTLSDATTFLSFRQGGNQKNLFESVLHVERSLLAKKESDGIVVLEQIVDNNIQNPQGASQFTVYHCRSR
jgi:hypothetical protein